MIDSGRKGSRGGLNGERRGHGERTRHEGENDNISFRRNGRECSVMDKRRITRKHAHKQLPHFILVTPTEDY
jgi:hypothetical protein